MLNFFRGNAEKICSQTNGNVLEFAKWNVFRDRCSRCIWMFQFVEKDLAAVFPNIETVLRICLSMICSNCSEERSFSKLDLIKNHFRSTMKDVRFSVLSIMNIKVKVLNMIEFDWESNAQLNHLNDITGTLYHH